MAAAAAQLRFSPLAGHSSSSSSSHLQRDLRLPSVSLPRFPSGPISPPTSRLSFFLPRSSAAPGLGGGGGGRNSSGGGRGFGGNGGGPSDPDPEEDRDRSGPLGLFLEGWRSRVAADPQFPFKVLMEELVGVTACVIGDMASRPNFGLNELDFVFSTLVVGSIVNFVLMYLLAPTAALSSAAAAVGPSYIFEPGPYSLSARIATAITKGATFAAVGFAAGLAGTAISNGLITVRKRLDPDFETPNAAPPTVLNALTWALHMGVSSNLRYQTLNGIEYVMAQALPPAAFKFSVVGLRCLNNVLGGMSFVMLARITGSQKSAEEKPVAAVEVEAKEKLLDNGAVAVSENEDH